MPLVPLKVMLGLMQCPVCPRQKRPANSAGYECAHFGQRGPNEPGTQECGSRLAAAAGFVFLDSQPFVDSLPHGIVGSICATSHPLGVLADALVLTLASLLLGHTRPNARRQMFMGSLHGQDHGQMVSWPPITTGMRASSLLCASDRACELTGEFKRHLERLASPVQSFYLLERKPGCVALPANMGAGRQRAAGSGRQAIIKSEASLIVLPDVDRVAQRAASCRSQQRTTTAAGSAPACATCLA